MRKAFLQLHAAVFLAGFTGILGKLITLNEGLLVWYRLMITCMALGILFFFQKKLVRVARKHILQIFGTGVIAALHWVTFYGSINYSNVSVALVCFSSIGFFTALLEPLIMNTRVKLAEVLLGLLTIVGISIIFHFDPRYKTGIIIGVISAVLGSLFPIINRRLLRDNSPETVTFYELSGGFLFLTVMLPVYLAFFPADHFIPTVSDLGWLLILSLFCTVLAFNLFMQSLQKISAFTVNLTYNLEPLYGIILAFIIFNENNSLSEGFYIGLSLIVLSVVLQTIIVYREHRKRK